MPQSAPKHTSNTTAQMPKDIASKNASLDTSTASSTISAPYASSNKSNALHYSTATSSNNPIDPSAPTASNPLNQHSPNNTHKASPSPTTRLKHFIKQTPLYALIRPVRAVYERCINAFLDDEHYFLRRHKRAFGYTPDFKNPQTFNEKIIHRILYDRNPIYTALADKLKARIYIALRLLPLYEKSLTQEQKTCAANLLKLDASAILKLDSMLFAPIDSLHSLLIETNICPYLPKLFGIYKSFDEIDFERLPSSFAIKTNHDGGGVVLIPDKKAFLTNPTSFHNASIKITKHLHTNFYTLFREWHYKDITPRIFIEELLHGSHYENSDLHNNTSLDANPKYNKALTPSHLNITHPIQSHASAINSHLITEATPSLNTLDSTSTNSPYFLKSPPITAIKSSSYTQSTPTHTQAPHQSLHSNIYTSHMLDSHATFKAPDDYKFHCFSKQVFIQVDTDRFTNHTRTIFDPSWQSLPLIYYYPNPHTTPKKPKNLRAMLHIARLISDGHAYLRIDFYNICGVIFIGELTFTPEGGTGQFTPKQWDSTWGQLWEHHMPRP